MTKRQGKKYLKRRNKLPVYQLLVGPDVIKPLIIENTGKKIATVFHTTSGIIQKVCTYQESVVYPKCRLDVFINGEWNTTTKEIE
jgi:hypothetical protein